MISATRKLRMCAGHRVVGHEGKCKHFHGHDYIFEVSARKKSSKHGGHNVDDIGRVIDFGVIKERLGDFIDNTWDHKMLISDDDEVVTGLVQALDSSPGTDEDEIFRSSIAWVPFNPTAENIAKYLGEEIAPELLPDDVEVFKVRLWETPNCFADWEL